MKIYLYILFIAVCACKTNMGSRKHSGLTNQAHDEPDDWKAIDEKIDELGKILTDYGQNIDETKPKNTNEANFDELSKSFNQSMTKDVKQSVRKDDYFELKEAIAAQSQEIETLSNQVDDLERKNEKEEEKAKKDKVINTIFGTFYLLAGSASLYVDARVISEVIQYSRDLGIVNTVLKDGYIDEKELAFLKDNHPRVFKKIQSSEYKGQGEAEVDHTKTTVITDQTDDLGKKVKAFQISDLDARIIKNEMLSSRNSSIKKGILAAALSSTVLIASLSYFGIGLTNEASGTMTMREQAMKSFILKALEIDDRIRAIKR